MVDFANPKEFRVYLDQTTTTSTYVNVAPSSLLTIIPVSDKSFSRTVHLSFACISEFSFKIADENDISIDNHSFTILS